MFYIPVFIGYWSLEGESYPLSVLKNVIVHPYLQALLILHIIPIVSAANGVIKFVISNKYKQLVYIFFV